MRVFSLVLCILVAEGVIGSSDLGNTLVDNILEEGNKFIRKETYLPEAVSVVYELGYKVDITAYGMKVSRDTAKVVRTRNATLGLDAANKGILAVHLSSGTVKVSIDNLIIVTPWRTYQSSAVLTFRGEFFVESVVDRSADCEHCDAVLRAIDMPTPDFTIKTKGVVGKLFDLFVNQLKGTDSMRHLLLRFFGPAFAKTTLEPFQPAVLHNLCNCTGKNTFK